MGGFQFLKYAGHCSIFDLPMSCSLPGVYLLFLSSLLLYACLLHCYSVSKSCPTACSPMDDGMSGSSTISQSLFRFMSIELVMLSNHLILCHPLLLLPSIFPSIRVFSHELAFIWGGQSIRASASASVLPVNIQGWFPLGLITLIL